MSNLTAENLFSVKGYIFVITGAGTGLGSMMARALDANGAAKVYVLGRRLDKLQEVAKQAINGSIVPIVADVTSKSDLEAAAAQVKAEVGYVNVVIANSGILGPTMGGLPKDRNVSISELQEYLWKVPQEEFSETFSVNVSGMMYTAIAFLSLLDAGNTSDESVTKAQGIKSQFIATSSIGAYNRIPAGGFAYAGSKAAVVHIIKQLSTHMAPYHIRANVIAPGIYPSEISAFFTKGQDMTIEGTVPASIVPATRLGSEEDMAGAVLTLSGRGGAYYNGFILITDGGRLGVLPSSY